MNPFPRDIEMGWMGKILAKSKVLGRLPLVFLSVLLLNCLIVSVVVAQPSQNVNLIGSLAGGVPIDIFVNGLSLSGDGIISGTPTATGVFGFTVRVRDTQQQTDTQALSITINPPADTTPPAAVTDLSVKEVAANSVALTWTAPGDDGNQGTATTYDIRYSTNTVRHDSCISDSG